MPIVITSGDAPDVTLVNIRWTSTYFDGLPALGYLYVTMTDKNRVIDVDADDESIAVLNREVAYPITPTIVTQVNNLGVSVDVEVGLAQFSLPASDDTDLFGTPFTYTAREELLLGGGGVYEFSVPVAAEAGGLDLSRLSATLVGNAPVRNLANGQSSLGVGNIAALVARAEAAAAAAEAAVAGLDFGSGDPGAPAIYDAIDLFRAGTVPLVLGEYPFTADRTGGSDAAGALVDLRDESGSRGGELVRAPAGLFAVASQVDWTGTGGIVGSGAAQVSTGKGTIFKLTDDSAGFQLGADSSGTVQATAGTFGRFTIDANSISGQAPAILIGRVGGCDFDPVRVENHSGNIAIAIYRIQNSLFRRWMISNVQNNGYVLDKGCGGLQFVTCNHSSAGLSGAGVGLLVHETTGDGPYAQGPSDIVWQQGIYERAASGQDALVWLKDGYNLLFEHTNFATGGAAVEPVELLRIGGGAGVRGIQEVVLRDPTFSSNVVSDSIGIHTLDPAVGRVSLQGRVILKNLATGIWMETDAELDASPARITAPGTPVTWDSPSALTRFPPLQGTRRGTNNTYTGITLANDLALAQTVEANARYRVRMRLSYNPETTTTKCVLGWQFPSGAIFDWTPDGPASAATSSSQASMNVARLTASDTVTLGGAALTTLAHPEGVLTTSSTAGTFGPKFAEAVAGAGVVINTNTYMQLERVG